MTRKFTKTCWIAALAVLALAGFAVMLSDVGSGVGPLWAPDGWVRTRILWRTPIGCSSNQVFAVINKHHWSVCSEDGGPGPTVGGGYVEERTIGVTHTPFETYVIAFWIFDKDGRLDDLRILDDRDSL